MNDFLEGLDDKPVEVKGWDSYEEPSEFPPLPPKDVYSVVIRGFSNVNEGSAVVQKDGKVSALILDFTIASGEFENRTITFNRVFAGEFEDRQGITRSGVLDLFKSFGLPKWQSQKDLVVQVQKAIESGKTGRIDYDQTIRCKTCADAFVLRETGQGDVKAAYKALSKDQNKKLNKYAIIANTYDKVVAIAKAGGKCPRCKSAVEPRGVIRRFLLSGEKASTPTTTFDPAKATSW